MQSAGNQAFTFRILGPLEVECAGRKVRLGGFRQQALLATLLLEAEHVVPIERLLEAIWEDTPPASAKGQVRICVSAIRRQFVGAGVGDLIETHPAGYRIRLPSTALDLARFEHLAALGRRAARDKQPEQAVDLFRSALAQWKGPVAAGLESRVLRQAATMLREEQLSVLEECVDLELQMGRHRKVVGELYRQVAENPYREQMCAQLMLALYRSGRQADALRQFRETRTLLSAELGIDPGESLRTLERAILAEDPSLETPSRPAPAQEGPAPVGSLIRQPVHRAVKTSWTDHTLAMRTRLTSLQQANLRLQATLKL
ncbi:BTAD domain-containing putative transcriptional regulator [Streptomyces noboritoensis]|uniref:BTAD domain-containing putative transcriptional regulator n=1 Tax=Streptomyces noboritoensis TaxID=67337 RepID=A0ABV6TPQ8_9ACTN